MTCIQSLLSPVVEIILTGEEKHAPTYGSDMAAGMDLRVVVPDGEIKLKPGQQAKLSAGFRLNMLTKNVAFVAIPRSGTGSKGAHLANVVGLIDADYQGEVFLVIKNNGNDDLPIADGDRLAQGIFVPVVHPSIKRVAEFSTVTQRGNGGFGSTGTK